MSRTDATTTTDTQAQAAWVSEEHVSFVRAVRSEYIKLRSLRSSWILILVSAIILIGIAALAAYGFTRAAGTPHPIPPPVIHAVAVTGLDFGQLVLAAFGAIFIGGEYGTGMIRSTMTAVPNRWAPICAKALVVAVTGFLVGVVSGFIGYFVAQPILRAQHLGFPLGTHGVLGSILGFALYLALATLLGLSIALLLRNSAGGIVVGLALLFVVPIIFGAVPLDILSDLAPYLPSESGAQMAHIDTSGSTLNQWQGGLVCTAWVAVLLGAGLVLTKIKDV